MRIVHPHRRATLVSRTASLLLLAALGTTCGGPAGPSIVSGGGGGIPNFEFGFRNQADAEHRFFLFPDAENVSSGSFVEPSNERLSDTAAASDITGTFSGDAMTFTIHRSAGNVAVTGRFLTSDTIELRFPSSVITVRRIQP